MSRTKQEVHPIHLAVGCGATGLLVAGLTLNYGPLMLLALFALTAGLLWNEDTIERGEDPVSTMLSTAVTAGETRRIKPPECACIRPAHVVDPDYGSRPHCYKCGKTAPRKSKRAS